MKVVGESPPIEEFNEIKRNIAKAKLSFPHLKEALQNPHFDINKVYALGVSSGLKYYLNFYLGIQNSAHFKSKSLFPPWFYRKDLIEMSWIAIDGIDIVRKIGFL